MPPHQADGSAAQFIWGFALSAVVTFAASQNAQAADHRVSPQTAKFDCSRVNPGDTITIPSGSRDPLTIQHCDGSSTNPIIIRNDPDGDGPAIIRRSSGSEGGFIFNCLNCVNVEIDGSYKWRGAPSGKTYGIKVTMTGGQGPSAFVRIGGLSRQFVMRNVEVDGAWPKLSASYGSGIRVNDTSVKRSQHPGIWREQILIEDNYVHDIRNEGMYIGPNYSNGDLPLRNIEVRYNRVEDIGWEGINTKSMWEGDNSIHHNEIRRTGKNASSKAGQYSGINNISGTVNIYNNWIDTTGQHGILVWTQDGPKTTENRGTFTTRIWNNVIVDAGALWKSSIKGGSFGINVGAQDGCEKPVPYVYNNTIVNSRQAAINLGSNVASGLVRDNIAAGSGANPVITVPKFVSLSNNQVGSVSQMGFEDPGRLKFRLNSGSPARNQGSNDFPPIDFDDVKRPRDGAPDQGAFEGSN